MDGSCSLGYNVHNSSNQPGTYPPCNEQCYETEEPSRYTMFQSLRYSAMLIQKSCRDPRRKEELRPCPSLERNAKVEQGLWQNPWCVCVAERWDNAGCSMVWIQPRREDPINTGRGICIYSPIEIPRQREQYGNHTRRLGQSCIFIDFNIMD